jgi:hypothetical protein
VACTAWCCATSLWHRGCCRPLSVLAHVSVRRHTPACCQLSLRYTTTKYSLPCLAGARGASLAVWRCQPASCSCTPWGQQPCALDTRAGMSIACKLGTSSVRRHSASKPASQQAAQHKNNGQRTPNLAAGLAAAAAAKGWQQQHHAPVRAPCPLTAAWLTQACRRQVSPGTR